MLASVTVGIGAGAPASQAGGGGGGSGDGITIRAVLDGKRLVFKGPSKVERRTTITVLSKTELKEVGAHTFSLVDKTLVPVVKNRKQGEACFSEGICGTIARAHKFDPKTEEINRPSVDKGRAGAWDAEFGKSGDSFYTEEKGGTETRKVVAAAGTELTFFCAVHPEMVKTVTVE